MSVRSLCFALLAVTAPGAHAQEPASMRLTSWQVRNNIYMIVGAGGNTTVQVGEDGVLVVDTKLPAASSVLLDAISQISSKPIRYMVNTHQHADHVGGNEPIARYGGTAVTGNHLFINGETVEILPQGAAHTEGDNLVVFHGSGVISTGDVFATGYPVIRPEDGGSIDGVIAALNRIVEIAALGENHEGGTLVIPGHGRLYKEADVVEYRNMVATIRDRIETMADMGMTLPEVQAARPTVDYDERYGAATALWTTEQFVAAAYQSLLARRQGGTGSEAAAAREAAQRQRTIAE
jgi:cyclase